MFYDPCIVNVFFVFVFSFALNIFLQKPATPLKLLETIFETLSTRSSHNLMVSKQDSFGSAKPNDRTAQRPS